MPFKIIHLPSPDIRDVINDVWEEADKVTLKCKEGLRDVPPDLSIGQSFIPYPGCIRDALVSEPPSELRYPPPEGRLETREVVADYLNIRYPGVAYTPSEIIITHGATGALDLCWALLGPKRAGESPDAVAVFEGTYAGYGAALNLLNRAVDLIIVPTERDFRPSVGHLRAALRAYPNIKLVLLNYPSNPTGVALSKSEVEALQALCLEFPEVTFVLDDAYESLSYVPSYSLLDNPACKHNVILIHSHSKTYSVPALGAGFAAVPESRLRPMKDKQAIATGRIPYPVDRVICAITKLETLRLTGVESEEATALSRWKEMHRSTYSEHTCFMQGALTELGLPTVLPQGGLFVFPDVSCLIGCPIPGKIGEVFENDTDVANYFLETEAAIVIPGTAFNTISGHYLRISCATSMEILAKAISNIRQHVSFILSDKAASIVAKQGESVRAAACGASVPLLCDSVLAVARADEAHLMSATSNVKDLFALDVVQGEHSFPFAEALVKYGVARKKVKTSGVLPSIPDKPMTEDNFTQAFDDDALRMIARKIQMALEKQGMNLSDVDKLTIIVDKDKYQLIRQSDFIHWLQKYFPNVIQDKIKITLGQLLYGCAIEIQARASQERPESVYGGKLMMRADALKQAFFSSSEKCFADNVKKTMTEMGVTLGARGMRYQDITEISVVVPNAEAFPDLNAEYTKHFSEHIYPVRYTYLDDGIVGEKGVQIRIKAERYITDQLPSSGIPTASLKL